MRTFKIDLEQCPQELRKGIDYIKSDRPDRFATNGSGTVVAFEKLEGEGAEGLEVSRNGNQIQVRYARLTDAFRALGRLLGEEGHEDGGFSENCRFDLLGVMIDVSRNGVMNLDAARAYLQRIALMGLNMAILYAEDTYEVPGEPFFGYLRGRYTEEELRALDQYAGALGIEMFPCIQTLAHLEQVLKWPAYFPYKDTNHILIAEHKPTYELLEKMIRAASAPFRSKRIHIGMDEAHGLGSGGYKKLHGEKDPFDIFNDHLSEVVGICRKMDLKPMIWSDMYFRLGSKTHDYYDKECVIPKEVAEKISKETQLVYWDYYKQDQAFYEDWIERHRALGFEPVMAGGIWTWNHLWAALPFSNPAMSACMKACKKKGLKEVFMTMWGDDGMECDVFSSLPGIQLVAEHAYSDAIDETLLRANFRGSCDAIYDDWNKACEIDYVPGTQNTKAINTSKWLLWQDPLLSMLDSEIDGPETAKHYAELSESLADAAAKTPNSDRLTFPMQIARVLARKCVLRRQLVDAYAGKDKDALRSILGSQLIPLRSEVDALWKCHRRMWLKTYKPFGLEVIERRYGGLRTRLESLADRLADHLEGHGELPELEEEMLPVFGGVGKVSSLSHGHVATPSQIK